MPVTTECTGSGRKARIGALLSEDLAMDPIAEHALWFVLGLLAGWISAWLVSIARRPGPSPAAHPELHAPPPLGEPETSEPEPVHVPSSVLLIDVAAARSAGFDIRHADDLSILEGIGPRIESLLRANGIASFVQLAASNEQELLDVLESGGPSFRFANPSRWAEQAALAAANEWAGLRQLQRELRGDLPLPPAH